MIPVHVAALIFFWFSDMVISFKDDAKVRLITLKGLLKSTMNALVRKISQKVPLDPFYRGIEVSKFQVRKFLLIQFQVRYFRNVPSASIK
jgi:hypothetical protein